MYAFVSPDNPNTVTIVANYIPLEEPAGGPNFAKFDDNVLYQIHIDNNGDARDDIAYQFRFTTTRQNANTFLYNTGPIGSLTDPNWNVRQTYSVTRVQNDDHGDRTMRPMCPLRPSTLAHARRPTTGTRRSRGHHAAYGIKVFAGQRDDPFFVDLGSIFDLGGLRPFNGAHLVPLATQPGVDGVGGYNTHSIVMQIPIEPVGSDPKAKRSSVIYASASRQKIHILRGDGTFKNADSWVQVSRLGNPLVNEVLIPLGKKDYWNSQDPAKDAQFLSSYTNPELAGLINVLYPVIGNNPATKVSTSNRADLVAILLTGVNVPNFANLNFTGNTPADLLRLNMGLTPNPHGACYAINPTPNDQPSSMGVLAGDLCGFPNGRRLADDVTDIECARWPKVTGAVVSSLLGVPNKTPNNQIGDGVNANDMPFLNAFPYVATPHQGYEHTHHAVGSTTTPPIP